MSTVLVFTSIPARRDGTVVLNLGGKPFVFARDEFEMLSCEIPSDVAHLIPDNGSFFSERPIVQPPAVATVVEKTADGDDDDDDDGDENGPLIEESVFSGSTPPVATSAKPRGRPRKS